MRIRMRCDANSWVAGVLTVALLAFMGCGAEADGESESIDSVGQALCTGVKLSSAPTGTLPSNNAALLTASNVTCAAGEVAEYRFMYKQDGDPAPYAEFRGWSPEPTATFDNTDRPSGKYTLQVRARTIGSTATQNSQATVVLSSGEVCPSVTLSASPKSPELPGKAISLLPNATCTGGRAEYRYLVKAPGTASFTPLGTWTETNGVWDTSGLVVGKYSLRVYARHVGNISNFESRRSVSFTLADTCHGVTTQFFPASPAPSGTLVAVEADATCPGGFTPEFRYDYRLKGTSAWSLLQNWSSEASAPWDTTGLGASTYQVRVQTRAPGVTAAQASKISDFKLSAP